MNEDFTPEVTHPHYQFPDGTLVNKGTVDNALRLINKLAQGCTLVELSDEELFSKGDKTSAIWRFYKKYDVPIAEAKAAIEYLRGEGT